MTPVRSTMETSAPVVVTGDGLTFRAEDGTVYLDAVSGTFNLPLGYNDPDVNAAVLRQVNTVSFLPSTFANFYAKSFAAKLLSHAPAYLDRCRVRDLTGSTANECAIKIAQKYTGRSTIISLARAHHGQTLFMTAISGNSFRREGFPGATSAHVCQVPAPYCHRCAYEAKFPQCELLCVRAIPDHIRHGTNGSVAAIIIEPVLGNGGNIVPPPGYFSALRKLCDDNGILLIADEVQTGIGRTGAMFASTAFDIRPDIITLAKGLGNGWPIGAVLMRSELDVLESSQHSFTSGGHLASLAAASATLDVVSRTGFLDEVRRKGAVLGRLLASLKERHCCVGDVRGLGFMWGVEIVGPEGQPDVAKTAAIVRYAQERHHLILRASQYGRGNVVKVRPALIATDDELEEIVRRLSATITDIDP